jgi:Thiol:disulfide interchange protein
MFVQLPPDVSGTVKLGLSLLACSPEHCIPVNALLDVPVTLPDDPRYTAASWENAHPGEALRKAPAAAAGLRTPPGGFPSHQVELPGLSPGAAPAMQGSPLVALPDAYEEHAWRFTPRPDTPHSDPSGLLSALFWGMVAGLVLNIMPCVLPVLTLKLSALLHAAGEHHERIRRFREHNLFFAAGVMTWFGLLALAVSLFGLTWGGLFQYPAVVACLASLVCLLGLSMLDICTLPIIDLKAGRSGSPRSQAYFTGITATLLATPCSGPLLGGVLAWSAMQPPLIVFIIFIGTGLGMSVPYLLFSLWPKAVALLPRPGKWLFVLERFVGIFLLGTATYLLLILPAGWAPALAVSYSLLACVFTWRRAVREKKPRPLFRAAIPLALGLLLAGWLIQRPYGPAHFASGSEEVGQQLDSPWEVFTPETFSEALGRDPILMQFTADWCPNCKVLEMTTLSPARLRELKARYGLRLLLVDMTGADPDRERLLRSLDSISIPLTALFIPGPEADRPVLLRDTYTPARLEAALATFLKETE